MLDHRYPIIQGIFQYVAKLIPIHLINKPLKLNEIEEEILQYVITDLPDHYLK